ncbi:MAG TPA: glycosyltransferase family 39 protein [Verrucomicrobiae bacterium]|nr:glycosyltransferase family 39 protein [Verrucomicrobiae bacterium]
MKSIFTKHSRQGLLLALTVLTFFFLLGSRSLNEPDEGRYAEIAREMLETGDWLVPHLWYLPHLDKPPMTYWLVAVSMKLFGQNEWAVRLPLALAGLGGVGAAFLLGRSLGGRRVAVWSALLLQSSLLYFVMARMLTTDIFLTAFNTWAMYCFWRSWTGSDPANRRTPTAARFLWPGAGWVFVALGFLTKGPIALAIPVVSFAALAVFRRPACPFFSGAGFLAGFALFLILTAPWFLIVFQRVPDAAQYMILGQAAGHLLGTTIKNRTGSFFYFFGILAFGLVPWTVLLGWLWRKNFWRRLDGKSKDGWLWLNVWAVFTFALFSLSHAKLPAYILPIFPALAVLLAWKFFGENPPDAVDQSDAFPAFVWRICLGSSLLLPAIFPLLARFLFHNTLPGWLNWQTPLVAAAAALVWWLARSWSWPTVAALTAGLAVAGFLITAAEIPLFETSLKANQTLQPLGAALARHFRPGDRVVCWGKFPQGLPFYSGGAISATNRPFLGDMDLTQVPFEFPGNRARLGGGYLPDENALANLLQSPQRVWLAGFGNTVQQFEKNHPGVPLHLLLRCGQWELFSN